MSDEEWVNADIETMANHISVDGSPITEYA